MRKPISYPEVSKADDPRRLAYYFFFFFLANTWSPAFFLTLFLGLLVLQLFLHRNWLSAKSYLQFHYLFIYGFPRTSTMVEEGDGRFEILTVRCLEDE